ncbi:MAG TPA: helix-turn-helix domain-containing protein [Candidatus Paceibacterota bacterium]
MIVETLTELNFSKNEAKIYETLLIDGELPVSKIAVRAGINRRNVYDSVNRLVEKGVAFEILQGAENRYQAVDPRKLMEIVKEKESKLEKIIPSLESLYQGARRDDSIYVYRGIEGWKNYMRELLRVGGDIYTLGAKGAWGDKRISSFYEQFEREAKRKKIRFFAIFDHEARHAIPSVLSMSSNKFFGPDLSTNSAIEILEDRIIIFSSIRPGEIDEKATYTVIANKAIADSMRTWFQIIWKATPEENKSGPKQ